MPRTRRDFVGSFLGLLVFLGGIALLLLVFKLAYDLFAIPPEIALKLKGAKTIDPIQTGGSLVGILIKSIVLVIMGLFGSLIANKGVHLYSHSLRETESAQPNKPLRPIA